MNKTIEAYLPGETQLVPKRERDELGEQCIDLHLDQLEAHLDEGGKLNERNALDLLRMAQHLRKQRDEAKEDARNRADRLDQIRRLA